MFGSAFVHRPDGRVAQPGGMARKRKAYLHVGMPGAGDIIEAALVHHRGALAELDVHAPARSPEETFLSAIEILREHRRWGYSRAEVEGQWADLCRRAWKSRGTIAMSLPLLARASRPEIDLLLDGIAGLEVHVVVTAAPTDAVDSVVERWGAAVRKPDRLHVIRLEQPSPAQSWRAFGKVAGFGTASLGLADVPLPVAVRPLGSLDEARREIERLTRRNQSLERWRTEKPRRRRAVTARYRARPTLVE